MANLQTIQSRIATVRGQKVMLDSDLAALYGVETRALNQAVRRNIARFEGDDFMFQLTKDEVAQVQSELQYALPASEANLKSQIVTSSWGGTRKLPLAFTELGVAMLSSVLRSATAIEVNRSIMRAFVEMRHFVTTTQGNYAELKRDIAEIKEYVEEILADQNDINEDTRTQLDAISVALAELQADRTRRQPARRPIGFIQ